MIDIVVVSTSAALEATKNGAPEIPFVSGTCPDQRLGWVLSSSSPAQQTAPNENADCCVGGAHLRQELTDLQGWEPQAKIVVEMMTLIA
ncbi:hypothetical protein OAS39_10860 [Pirellulales bacterium]|nr:hypothetical protein [Pirellulales bacterium]